jgi:hypothetical protein
MGTKTERNRMAAAGFFKRRLSALQFPTVVVVLLASVRSELINKNDFSSRFYSHSHWVYSLFRCFSR